MRLPKENTTRANDEPVFKPIRDLQTIYIDRRNSWSAPSHLPAQPSPLTSSEPSTTISNPANHVPTTASPIKLPKPTTVVKIPASNLPPTPYPTTPSKPIIPPSHLPPTPSPTPTRNLKRSYSSLIEVRLPTPTPTPDKKQKPLPSSSPSPHPTKRPRPSSSTPRATPIFPHTHTHNPLTPPFSIRYRRPLTPSTPPISAVELKRAAESILRQVNWDTVAEDVASNRKSGVFRKVVREVLQGGVDRLVEEGL